MPCGEVNFDITPQPEKHMFECQYITMVAVMLAFPMWRKPPYVPGDWPPPDEVERARHGLEKQLIQFNVGPSVMDDELGLSYETLAISGLYLASEPEFLDTLRHRCLMCGKAFFTQWKFVDHLQQHNFCQLDTYMCYHRLQLRSLETVGHPCHFCAQFEHATSLGKICVPLLHLAIFLCNGSPGLPSRRNLEGCLDPRSDGCTGDQHTGLPAAQASQGRQASAKEDIRFFFRRSSTTGCQIGPEDGRHLESGASGASVCDASAAGSGQHLSHSPGSITEVAQGGEDDAPQTAVVIHAGPDVACQSGDPGEHPADGATLGDMPEQGIDRQPGCNALSEVEREGQKVGAFEGAWHSDQGDRQQSPTAESLGAGPHDDSEIPLVGKEDGGVRSGSAMVVAFEQSSQLRGLASSTPIVLQRFLATDWGPNSSTRHRSDTAGQGHPEGFVQRSVKLMMNNSNHCYANACILILTWMTLKMGALDTAFWPAGGFELFRNMTTDCWLPLCLKTCRPFLWLLGDGWSTGDLDIQNDAAEFLQWFFCAPDLLSSIAVGRRNICDTWGSKICAMDLKKVAHMD